MKEYVNAQVGTDRAMPLGIAFMGTVRDSAGDYFSPESCISSYAYDSSGNLITETVTDGTNSWVQTYTYTSGQLTGISKWVKQ